MRRNNFNKIIPICALIISLLSLLILSGIEHTIFVRQLINIIIGLIAFGIFSFLPYRIYKNAWRPLFVGCLVLLALPLLFGRIIRGSSRWISFGSWSFQPSEIAKPFIIAFLAGAPANFIPFLLLIPTVGLIFFQPDLGSSLIILISAAGTLIRQKKTRRFLLLSLGVIVLLTPVFWQMLEPFQKQRLTTFLNPQANPLGESYQAQQALITVGSGKMLGRGLGIGSQSRLAFLPERHNDLLFASFIEAFGFLGGVLLLGLYFVLFWQILQTIEKIKDEFGQKFILGCWTLLFIQTTINIGMNMGLLPITGITLPLFSYGGSSYIATMIILGVMEAITSQQVRQPLREIRIR